MNTARGLWLMVAGQLALMGAFWWATARLQEAGQRHGLQAMAGFNLGMALGLVLVAMRGSDWPGLLTLAGANVVMLTALGLLWHGGAMQLRGRSRAEPFIVVGLGASLILLSHVLGAPDTVRVAVFYLACAWIIHRAYALARPLLIQGGVHGHRVQRVLRVLARLTTVCLTVWSVGGLWLGLPIDVGSEAWRSYLAAFGVLFALTVVNGMLAYAVVRQLLQELERMASHDSLTGLLNRRAFERVCEARWRAWQRDGTRFALLCLDVDHFKSVNDRGGHGVGDAVLQAISAELLRQIRPGDDAARIGGEELVLVMGRVGSDDEAWTAAERLRRAIEALPPPAALHGRPVTASLGVAIVCDPDTCAADVQVRADLALYRAKAEGRNRVCMAPSEAA